MLIDKERSAQAFCHTVVSFTVLLSEFGALRSFIGNVANTIVPMMHMAEKTP